MSSVGGTCHEWLWEADAELRLTYSSPAAFTLLGYTPDQLMGQTIPSLLGGNGDQCCRRMLAAALATQSGWHDKAARWRHADGYLVELQGSAVPIVNDIGEVVGFRGSRRAATATVDLTQALGNAHERLTKALADRSFDIALQPIVDVGRGTLVGAEALARFRDGRSPDRWFAEARMTGQSLDLERATFFAALPKLGHLPPGAYLSVNASPELVTDPEFIDCLTYGSAPLGRLVVEITEHVAITTYDDLRQCLAPLRRRGLRVAVDDTGAGYASFSHVLQLRPDIIKIDRSIISSLTDDPARRSLVTAMVVLALELGASVTAEGVETSAELNTLASLAVDHAQGYLLARPTTDPVEWASWRRFAWLTPRELAGLAV